MNWWKICGIAVGLGVSSEILYYLFKRYRKHGLALSIKTESKNEKIVEEVLFFPDQEIACKDYFVGEDGCQHTGCKFLHEKSSLSRLYEFLHEAKFSLDVCVFLICCTDLADLLILAHKRNVRVRVICDNEQVDISGSQIWKLRKEG